MCTVRCAQICCTHAYTNTHSHTFLWQTEKAESESEGPREDSPEENGASTSCRLSIASRVFLLLVARSSHVLARLENRTDCNNRKKTTWGATLTKSRGALFQRHWGGALARCESSTRILSILQEVATTGGRDDVPRRRGTKSGERLRALCRRPECTHIDRWIVGRRSRLSSILGTGSLAVYVPRARVLSRDSHLASHTPWSRRPCRRSQLVQQHGITQSRIASPPYDTIKARRPFCTGGSVVRSERASALLHPRLANSAPPGWN